MMEQPYAHKGPQHIAGQTTEKNIMMIDIAPYFSVIEGMEASS
jgi:hypothetical protein